MERRNIMYQIKKFSWDSQRDYIIRDNGDGTTTCIPADESNSDYQTYLKWLDGYEFVPRTGWVKTSESNTPLPADE